MWYYGRTDLSKVIDLTKSKISKECTVSHYFCFIHGSNFKSSCNGCHKLTTLLRNLSNIVISAFKGADYR